jgi:hypothetical protein
MAPLSGSTGTGSSGWRPGRAIPGQSQRRHSPRNGCVEARFRVAWLVVGQAGLLRGRVKPQLEFLDCLSKNHHCLGEIAHYADRLCKVRVGRRCVPSNGSCPSLSRIVAEMSSTSPVTANRPTAKGQRALRDRCARALRARRLPGTVLEGRTFPHGRRRSCAEPITARLGRTDFNCAAGGAPCRVRGVLRGDGDRPRAPAARASCRAQLDSGARTRGTQSP